MPAEINLSPRHRHPSVARRCRRLTATLVGFAAVLSLAAPSAHAQVSVTTHHYDNIRSGWNQNETALTVAALKTPPHGRQFGILHKVVLDAQVDAQPLVVPNAVIDGDPNSGGHDVAFVVTENNTVYAIDPGRGTVLHTRTLGPAVKLPLGCTNNAATVGITSTPVIDLPTKTIYAMAYVQLAAGPAYQLHRMNLHDFSDKVPPVTVVATHPLTDGSTVTFNAKYQRQRPALLLNHGAVFAAFGSFCDFDANTSRGWLLGWRSDTLAPLQTNATPATPTSLLVDQQAVSPKNVFLGSIWMSGAGVASDGNGSLYAVTANSDGSKLTYDGVTDIQESVVKFDPTTNHVQSVFTPFNEQALDKIDQDFGAGGVMLLPASVAGLPPRLAVAAGKNGTMFLMNRDALGGFNGPAGPDKVVGSVAIGHCFCSPTYYASTAPKIITSGGSTIQVWTLNGNPAQPLLPGPKFALPPSIQDGGSFTAFSSSGHDEGIIWAVGRPVDAAPADIMLYAIQSAPVAGSSSLVKLYSRVAGTWPTSGANANITPVVANGLVYVASYKLLSIFGLGGI